MIFDDETLSALGFGEALDLRDTRDSDADRYVVDVTDDANGRMTRSARSVVLVAQMTDEQRRAYWREKKAAWRARRPDLDADAERRARRAKGHRSMATHLRRVADAAMPAEERAGHQREWYQRLDDEARQARRERDAERARARRERLGPEAVRAENLRHQHAKRERDRAEAAE